MVRHDQPDPSLVMSQRRALSAAQVNALAADGVHRVAPSLYLQIRPQGTRSWLFRYSRNGGRAEHTPGTSPKTTG